MKYIDKFLKFLKTDRNTFATYILTLLTAYIVVDRLVEMLLIAFTGTSSNYWGPIVYTLAMACPVFAFLFSFSSKFVKGSQYKLSFFYTYCIALYVIAISMLVQWSNQLGWLLFFSVPNYKDIIINFSDLIKPAFSAFGIYIPLVTAPYLFRFLYAKVHDTKAMTDSIKDFGGIDLSDKKIGTGPYTCEVAICKNKDTGKMVKTPEMRRFEATLICGVSGSGKTTMVFEPMIARDIEKKYFFREVSKEKGFTALKTGIAYLNCPYDNEYMNKNFTLNMITPKEEKMKVYTTYMQDLLYNSDPDNLVYKNLGITYVAPDAESVKRIKGVAKNFGIPVNIIDPSDSNSIGLNPFIYDNATKTAIVISSVLKGMYSSNTTVEQAYRDDAARQAVENLSIILKEMYPRLHEGQLPTLEDMLNMLNDFDKVEKMCRQMEMDDELTEKYSLQLGYFKKYFYRESNNRKDTEKFVYSAITQLDNLLRYPGVKEILCNRTNNVDFDKALANGEVTLLCTRRGDLGATAHQAFGLFFLLLMQYSVLVRPGNEKTRIPHFLYIDEFPDFLCKATEAIFTLYRKYRVGTIISTQNLAQFGNEKSEFRQTILANCTTKLVFGNNTPEENQWWSNEFGKHREWQFGNDYHTDPKSGEPGYDESLKGIKWGWKEYFAPGKIQTMKFKQCAVKTKDIKGKSVICGGSVDFLEGKYKKEQEIKEYPFYQYNKVAMTHEEPHRIIKRRKKVNQESEDDEYNPIQTDTTDAKYFLDSDEAITFDLNKKE